MGEWAIWSWPAWTWAGWAALGSIGALAVVLVTVFGLLAANKTAREASKNATEAILTANERAERDLYRDLLSELAANVGIAQDTHTPEGLAARKRCVGLVSVLPFDLFPLPASREHFGVFNRQQPPELTIQQAINQNPTATILQEVADSVAALHGRPMLRSVSSDAGTADHISVEVGPGK